MNPPDDLILQERSRALAIVLLTERDDLQIRAGNDEGVDLLVSLKRPEKLALLRRFGVVLSASVEPATATDIPDLLDVRVVQRLAEAEFSFPVCVFHFTMRDNRGYLAWYLEPALTADGPRLLRHNRMSFDSMSKSTADELVARVAPWWDAFFSQVLVEVG